MKLFTFFKKLKERGFTLIELIATIALLAIIALISFVSINAVINKNKEKQYKNLVSSIKIAAKQYASENKHSEAFSDKSEVVIHLSDLSGYISMPIIDPYTNQAISNIDEIEIILHMDNGNVKEVVINGMPEHGNSTSNSGSDIQGEIVDNNGNSATIDTDTNNDENNENNNGSNEGNENSGNNTGNNGSQTYKVTLSCESDSTMSYGGCRFANDGANYIATINAAPGTVINLGADSCYCGKGYYYQNAWFYLEGNQLVGLGSFTMPDHDVTLFAVYG